MQHRAIRLMASKLAVAGIIEGNFTDEGLAAMSDCADMTTALARELTQGIKNEVEDLSAVFKKMAILKPEFDITETENIVARDDVIVIDDKPVIQVYQKYPKYSKYPAYIIIDDTSEVAAYNTDAPTPLSGLLSFVNNAKPTIIARRKAVFTDENQFALLDFFEAAA